jgi:hypothetical protein
MKNVFVNFTFAKLRNSELPEMTKAILETVEKFNPESMKIAGMYNLLSELQPLLDILAVKYNGYPVSADYKDQCKLRNNLLVAIHSQITAIEKARVTTMAQQAQLAIPYLNGYLKGISTESDSVKSGRVNQMLNGLTDNDEMNTALSVLGITPFMEELKGYQQQLNLGESLRRESLAVRPKFNNKDARSRVITAIENLLKAIELAKVEYTELDYTSLINELNVVLTNRQTVIKSRATRSKNFVANTTTVALSTKTEATAV